MHNPLTLLSNNSLQIYDDICKRSARFTVDNNNSDNNFVKSAVNYGILARCHSVVGRNGMFLTRRYVWSLDQLVSAQLLLHNADFIARYLSTVTSDKSKSTHFAMKLLCLREHSSEFSNNSTNSRSFLYLYLC